MQGQNATFQTYLNIGIEPLPGSKNAALQAYVNIGLQPLIPTKEALAQSYLNIGLEREIPKQIIRQPRGWGYIPNTSQTILVLGKSSSATFQAYNNITS